jgi:hypothetical protein
MADVYAIFGTLLSLGIAFPGMLTAMWLLFPETVERARVRVHITPWRCFWFGVGTTLAVSLPISILLALPVGAAKIIGAVLLFLTLTTASLGTAGITAEMSERLESHLNGRTSSAGRYLRAGVALELAAAFPIIGWFIVIPVTLMTSMGAAVFSLLRWLPKPIAHLTPEAVPSQA